MTLLFCFTTNIQSFKSFLLYLHDFTFAPVTVLSGLSGEAKASDTDAEEAKTDKAEVDEAEICDVEALLCAYKIYFDQEFSWFWI